MKLSTYWLLRLLFTITLIGLLDARRVRVEPVDDYEEDSYYTSDPQDDGSNRAAVVLVGGNGGYNGLYSQARSSGQDNYIPATTRSSTSGRAFKELRPHTKESNKASPVQTIRNYNKVNDDGSFTFGYEAADGSFKEETRGTDCVVRGKYGYIDPDGNKREFTYVSGNPCDPNAPKDEEEEPSREVSEENSSVERENVPANYPSRPIRPLRPVTTTIATPIAKTVPLYQDLYQQEEIEPEPEQVLKAQPVQPIRHRLVTARPSYTAINEQQYVTRPRVLSTTPSYEESRPLTITPRPVTVSPSATKAQPPATTYRPQLLQLSVTPRPALVYTTKQISEPSRITSSGSAARDFAAEYQKFQLDNQISSTVSPSVHRNSKPSVLQTDVQANSNPVYSSELIFDPSSGQYKTALYQSLPQTEGEFSINHRIQPYVHQPAPQLVNFHQLQQQSPLYRQTTTPRANQAVYQAQQAELQFQNSQQLFAQQQRARAQQQQTQAQAQPAKPEPQQFYYIQPQALQGVSNGQIDAFLRGHNIQF